jgi:hypothetical protein
MSKFFAEVSRPSTLTGRIIDQLQSNVVGQQLIPATVTGTALSLESANDSARSAFHSVQNQLAASLESIASDLGINSMLTIAQRQSAIVAGMLAGDWKKQLIFKSSPLVATENQSIVSGFNDSDSFDNRSFALEAYDESENRNAVIYSIAYNMQASRQDEFGETFFPTLTLTPDNAGFGVSVNLMMVYNGTEHKISGDMAEFNKRHIIRAVVDHTILKKEQTRAIPVHRAASAVHFTAPADVAPYALDVEGESINTAPLAVNKKHNILALSQTDALVAGGLMDMTDTLDRTITMQAVYLKVGADVIRVYVDNLPTSNFVSASQGNYRQQNLNMKTTSILLKAATKRVDGSALVDLADIGANNYNVRLEVAMSGDVNIETGELNVYANAVSVHSMTDSTGAILGLTAGTPKTIADLIATGTIIGYDVKAYRSNLNRRQRGQFIDVTRYNQLYNVPLRSPITTIHPMNTDGSVDASDVQALITATHIRLSNEAVSALLNAAATLNDYVASTDNLTIPDVLGVGRWYVRPTYMTEILDVSTQIDSVKSHERAADIQAVMVNKLRDMAYRMYRDSEYKAAADALSGGMSAVPTVIIGTDPVIARYLNVSGDLRTLSGEFQVRIVTTLDNRVAGKIFMTFGTFDDTRNTTVNPLNFGNMVWGPELVLTANISRGQTTSKETVVQPRYLHVVHCPIMATLEVRNIPQTLSKVPVHTRVLP